MDNVIISVLCVANSCHTEHFVGLLAVLSDSQVAQRNDLFLFKPPADIVRRNKM